jgi:hypothetical protein
MTDDDIDAFMENVDFERFYRETYERLKIGDRVQILLERFEKGTVIDKHFGMGYWTNEPFIDVLLDSGKIIERHRCYSCCYPRFDWIDA